MGIGVEGSFVLKLCALRRGRSGIDRCGKSNLQLTAIEYSGIWRARSFVEGMANVLAMLSGVVEVTREGTGSKSQMSQGRVHQQMLREISIFKGKVTVRKPMVN